MIEIFYILIVVVITNFRTKMKSIVPYVNPQHVWRGQKKKKINSVFIMKSTFMNFLLPEGI